MTDESKRPIETIAPPTRTIVRSADFTTVVLPATNRIFHPDEHGKLLYQKGNTCWMDSILFVLESDMIRERIKSKLFLYLKDSETDNYNPHLPIFNLKSSASYSENLFWFLHAFSLLKSHAIILSNNDNLSDPSTILVRQSSAQKVCDATLQISYQLQNELINTLLGINMEDQTGNSAIFFPEMIKYYNLPLQTKILSGRELEKKIDLTAQAWLLELSTGNNMNHEVAISKVNGKFYYLNNEYKGKELISRTSECNLTDKTYLDMLHQCYEEFSHYQIQSVMEIKMTGVERTEYPIRVILSEINLIPYLNYTSHRIFPDILGHLISPNCLQYLKNILTSQYDATFLQILQQINRLLKSYLATPSEISSTLINNIINSIQKKEISCDSELSLSILSRTIEILTTHNDHLKMNDANNSWVFWQTASQILLADKTEDEKREWETKNFIQCVTSYTVNSDNIYIWSKTNIPSPGYDVIISHIEKAFEADYYLADFISSELDQIVVSKYYLSQAKFPFWERFFSQKNFFQNILSDFINIYPTIFNHFANHAKWPTPTEEEKKLVKEKYASYLDEFLIDSHFLAHFDIDYQVFLDENLMIQYAAQFSLFRHLSQIEIQLDDLPLENKMTLLDDITYLERIYDKLFAPIHLAEFPDYISAGNSLIDFMFYLIDKMEAIRETYSLMCNCIFLFFVNKLLPSLIVIDHLDDIIINGFQKFILLIKNLPPYQNISLRGTFHFNDVRFWNHMNHPDYAFTPKVGYYYKIIGEVTLLNSGALTMTKDPLPSADDTSEDEDIKYEEEYQYDSDHYGGGTQRFSITYPSS